MNRDRKYLNILLTPMRECAKYKPAFGRGGTEGVSIEQFRVLYGADPLYHWVGLDSDLMYAAHKAAGGMTSIYRQLGVGCERLAREIVKDQFNLDDDEAVWSYEYVKEDGDNGIHYLDARIDLEFINDRAASARVKDWLKRAAAELGLPPARTKQLRGILLEVRQGYKSADSKRQNADLRYGARAYNENYLPTVPIMSTQASLTVCRRYRASQILVLLGTTNGSDVDSTFSFFRSVVGYDIGSFFERNSVSLRTDFTEILKGLLTPD